MEVSRKRSELTYEEIEDIARRRRTYAFKGHVVRTVEHDGQKWVVFADVCNVLGYKNPRHQVKFIRDEDKCKLDIGLKNTLVNCVNRRAIRSIAILTGRPDAAGFSDWADWEIFKEEVR